MLPEALAFVAKPQHLNGKRDRFIRKVQTFCFKKNKAKMLITFYIAKLVIFFIQNKTPTNLW